MLAIDRGFVGGLIMTILGAMAIAFGGMGIAVAIAVVVFIKRRRAQRAAGVLTARPGCVPTYLPEPAGIVQCAAAIVSHIKKIAGSKR